MSTLVVVGATATPFLLLLIGLGFSALSNSYISRRQKSLMLLLLFFTATLIVQNAALYLLNNGNATWFLKTLFSVYGYAVRPVILSIFCVIISGGKKSIPAWVFTGVNAAVYLTAFEAEKSIAFHFSENLVFLRGPLGYTCHIISAGLMVYLLVIILMKVKTNKKEMILPIVSTLLIVGATVIDTFVQLADSFVLSCLTVAIVLSCNFYYFWFNTLIVREFETDLLSEQRMKIMISQIQPHFLYNTLATIRALCRKDPEKAAQVTEEFGQYLRRNMDSLSNAELIPVDKELEHTRLYAEIEMVRFENIRVIFDVKDKGFSVPALTIQPMVENAIRHGVRLKENGVVSVSTRLAYGYHEITIRDNGIGFDETKAHGTEGAHIGIANVRARIENLCGGTVDITSEKGNGTTVLIKIPV